MINRLIVMGSFLFGDQVRVDFFDAQGRRIRVANGDDRVIVPEGRTRFQVRV